MSDESQTAVAPEAPVETQPDATPAPETTPTEPAPAGGEAPDTEPDTRTVRERKSDIARKARGDQSVASKINQGEASQPRDEHGRFASQQDGADEASAPEGQETAAEPSETPETSEQDEAPVTASDGATETEASEGPPEGMVRIELPDKHPLRSRGVEHIDFPQDQEEYGRWSVNQGLRVQQFNTAQQQLREEAQAAAEARAEAEFWRDHGSDIFGHEFRTQYEDIKNTYGEAAAERFKRGQLVEAQQGIQERKLKARAATSVTAFKKQLSTEAPKMFPGWNWEGVNKALRSYGSLVHAENGDESALDLKRFRQHAWPIYAASPAGRRFLAQRNAKLGSTLEQRAQQKARQEAKQREQERLQKAAQAKRDNPMGQMDARTGRSTPDSDPNDGLTVPQRLKRLKDRARRGIKTS